MFESTVKYSMSAKPTSQGKNYNLLYTLLLVTHYRLEFN
jgi:hypothetical protein